MLEPIEISQVKKIAIKNQNANIQSVVFKETLANGDTVHTMAFTNGTTYDLLTHAGVASYRGQYLNLATVNTAFPNGIADTQFIFTYDEVTTENPNGTGVVSLLQYDNTSKVWKGIKLNQAIPIGTSGDAIGFTGTTAARLALINNVDYNNKEFLYWDTDLNVLLVYFPLDLAYYQYDGQKLSDEPAPQNPVDGEVLIGEERVYAWDDANKLWKVKLKDYIRKHEPTQGGYTSHILNGSEIRVHRDTSDNIWMSMHQNNGMDTVIYSLDDSISQKIVLSQGQESIIVPSNIDVGNLHLLTVELVHNGDGQAISFIRYGNTVYVTEHVKLLVGDTSFTSMITSERLLYLTDTGKDKKRFVYDTDLGVLMQYIPNNGHIGSFVEFRGQSENGAFPYTDLTNGELHVSNGNEYIYNAAEQYWILNLESTILPMMDGVAVAGTSKKCSREGHIHPSDTSKLNVTDAPTIPIWGGNTPMRAGETRKCTTTVGGFIAGQLIISKEERNTDPIFNSTEAAHWELAGVGAGTATPLMGGTAAVGTGTKYAREDHKHPSDTSRLAASVYTASDILAKLKTVDGSGSGLDADTLDGNNSSYFAPLNSPAFTGNSTGSSPAVAVNITSSNSSGGYDWTMTEFASNMTAEKIIQHYIGQSPSSKNAGYFGFKYAGAGLDANLFVLGMYGVGEILSITGGGYVKLGSGAPAIKTKKMSDTTPSANSYGAWATGIHKSKVLAVNVFVTSTDNKLIPPHRGVQGTSTDYYLFYIATDNNLVISIPSTSTAVGSRPWTALITYEE